MFVANRRTLVLFLIMGASLFLTLLCIRDGHNWGGDFALYINQTLALQNGSVHSLYIENKFAVQHSDFEFGPYLYPFGFPILLLPFVAAFGLHLITFKVLCAVFFIGSLPFIYKLFKNNFGDTFLAFSTLCLIAFHEKFLIYTSNVLSDLPFFFFTFLSFFLLQKRVSLFTQVLLGLSVFYAYFIRDIGIILIPTLLIFQIQNQQKTDSKNRLMLQLIPYFIFAFLFLFVRLIFPAGNENHYSMLFSDFSPAAMAQNSSYYSRTFAELFVGEQNIVLFYFLIPIAAIGCFSAKKQAHFIFYFFFTWIIVSAWPVIQGERFLFPLIPLFLLFFVRGLQLIFSLFRNSKRFLYLTMGLLSIFFVVSAIPKVLDFRRGDHNEACSREMKIMYTFISNHTKRTDLIAFFKPTVLRLFTGRNSILVSSEHFERSQAHYLLTEVSDTMKIQNSCIPVFTSGNYVLLTRKLPNKLGI